LAEEAIQQLKQQLQQAGEHIKGMEADRSIQAAEVQIKMMEAETKRMQLAPQESAPAVAPDHSFDQWKAQFEADVKMQLEDKQQEGAERLELIKQREPAIIAQEMAEQLQQQLAPVMEQVQALAQGNEVIRAHQVAPRKKIRDASGKLVAVEINGAQVPIGE